jgi:tRNA (cytidine/uridine-2'-O-)-methyltransferase
MHVVLIEPEIPQNTGSVARLCAGTDTPLHLVGALGFSLADRYLKRAGLDYWPSVDLHRHASVDEWLASLGGAPFWLFTARAGAPYTDVVYGAEDRIVFGRESVGLPNDLLARFPERRVRIPIRAAIRSLNLSNAVSVALFEGLRQQGWR